MRNRLEAVMTDWSLPEITLYLLTPPSGFRPARVSVLIEYLRDPLSGAARVVTAGKVRGRNDEASFGVGSYLKLDVARGAQRKRSN